MAVGAGIIWKIVFSKNPLREVQLAKPVSIQPAKPQATVPAPPRVVVVEAPKVAPAPAGETPLTPEQTAQLAQRAQKKQQMQANLEQFRIQSAAVLQQAEQKANGDPAALAKLNNARQQYDAFMQNMQSQIDALDAQPLPGGS